MPCTTTELCRQPCTEGLTPEATGDRQVREWPLRRTEARQGREDAEAKRCKWKTEATVVDDVRTVNAELRRLGLSTAHDRMRGPM